MEPIIRNMQEKDIVLLSRIALKSNLAPVYGFTLETWTSNLKNALHDGVSLLIVAEYDASPVGFAWVNPKGAFMSAPYLRFIAVDSDCQGKGIGSYLLREFEKQTAFLQKDYFLLVSDFNHEAQLFYERNGYSKVGELPDFAVVGVSELIMVKKNRDGNP